MKKLSLFITLLCFMVSFSLAQRTVVGSVTDQDGEPLIGASVLVKGTSTGTVTDIEGKYSVDVPEGSNTLVYSYTGYDSKEITLGASNVVNVELSEGITLETAVVTALGISREEKSLGYAVKRVDGEEVVRAGETNVVQSLAAKASGVQVIGSGGTPGASSKVLIRGNSTFTGENQPLFVVDGIPYDNKTESSVAGDYPFNANLSGVNNSNRALDINPADIESVNILKGPAAAALYGTRAANGVILITTKKGRQGINVNFSSSLAIDQVNKLPELQMSYGQGTGGGAYNATTGEVTAEGTYMDEVPLSWGPAIGDPSVPEAYDNLDTYFETGMTYNNNLSVSMGNENTTFRLSYGNTNQTGIVPNTELNRNSFRLTANSTLNKFQLSGTAAYVNTQDTKAQNGSNLSGVMLSLTRMPPSFNVVGGEGPNGYDNPDGSDYSYFSPYDNPLWSAYNNPLTGDVNRITGGITGTYMALPWLDITARISSDAYTDERKQIFAIGANDPPAPVGEVWENTKTWLEVNADAFVTARRDLSDDFNGVFMVGMNLNHRSLEDIFARGRNLAVPGFYNIGNASDLYNSQQTETRRLAGVYFDLNFGFRDMLYLGISGRNDWASTFGEDARNSGFFYPAANLAWVFSEMMESSVLRYGKLRLSYAQAGIEPTPYRTATYYTAPFITDGFTDGLSFPYGGQNGFGLSDILGNADLEPEINTTIEAGVELNFWNRLNLDVNYYNSKSSNLLVLRPIATSTGFEVIYTNIGEMVNQGVEVELGANIVNLRNFAWDIGGNFTMNENEVTQLAPGVDEIDIEAAFASIGSYAIVGQPYGALFATQWARSDNGQLLIQANGLPLVDATRGNVGNPYPDWLAGIRNTFTVFGVRISGLLDIREGGDLWNGTFARLNRFGTTEASAARDQTYVIPGVLITGTDDDGNPISDGTPNDIQISANSYFSNYLGDSGAAATEQAVQDGSWVRLRELTISYDFPMLNTSGFVKGLNIYFTGRNLWLSTDYEGVDPETSLTGAGSNVGGFDYFNMPSTKSFIFGLDVSF